MSDFATNGGTYASMSAGLDAEATEEQHLDDRHATSEHYTGGSSADLDPLLDLDGDIL